MATAVAEGIRARLTGLAVTVAAVRLSLRSCLIRRTERGGEVSENRWSSAAVRHYRAAEPSRPAKEVPLYTL
jgi:hypothetical protein